MSGPTTPRDRTATGGGGRLRDASLAVLFAIGVVMALTREDLRPLGLLLVIVSAAVFLAGTIARRVGRGPGR
jgi:drug/metabolite transporter (DMT)-like permease